MAMRVNPGIRSVSATPPAHPKQAAQVKALVDEAIRELPGTQRGDYVSVKEVAGNPILEAGFRSLALAIAKSELNLRDSSAEVFLSGRQSLPAHRLVNLLDMASKRAAMIVGSTGADAEATLLSVIEKLANRPFGMSAAQ